MSEAHPTEAGLVYKTWANGREQWHTVSKYHADLKKRAEYGRAHYNANKEVYKVKRAASYSANRDKEIARMAAWKAANPDKVKNYRMANPGSYNHNRVSYRARAIGQAPELTADETAACVGTYAQCQRLNKILGKKAFEVDHTKPMSLGGFHHPSNLQIVPTKWNREKASKHSNRWEAPYEG